MTVPVNRAWCEEVDIDERFDRLVPAAGADREGGRMCKDQRREVGISRASQGSIGCGDTGGGAPRSDGERPTRLSRQSHESGGAWRSTESLQALPLDNYSHSTHEANASSSPCSRAHMCDTAAATLSTRSRHRDAGLPAQQVVREETNGKMAKEMDGKIAQDTNGKIAQEMDDVAGTLAELAGMHSAGDVMCCDEGDR